MDESEIDLGIKQVEESSTSNGNFKIFKKMELLEFKDKFVIRAIDSIADGFFVNHPLSSDDNLDAPTKILTICGVAGAIWLVAGVYILVTSGNFV